MKRTFTISIYMQMYNTIHIKITIKLLATYDSNALHSNSEIMINTPPFKSFYEIQ